MTVTEMTLQTCISPWLCQIVMPGAVLKLMYFGSTMFLHHSQKMSKIVWIKRVLYSVRRWRWIKLTFPQNPDFVVLYSNFVQNQVTAPRNNCLAWHVLKDRSSVSILPFFVNSNDTSKIRDGDDANCRDKIFQTKTGKQKCFNMLSITFFNRFNKLKYLIPIN